jgi:hypothetical protein
MPRLFLPALCALFVLMLAACETGIDAQTVALPAQVEQRCASCGWIESKREIASSVVDPHSLGVYEYTLRMADGSSRVFRETLPTTWRLGERLTLIDGRDASLN